jgi:hypothetical protein
LALARTLSVKAIFIAIRKKIGVVPDAHFAVPVAMTERCPLVHAFRS